MNKQVLLQYIESKRLDLKIYDQMIVFLTEQEDFIKEKRISESLESINDKGLDQVVSNMVLTKHNNLDEFHMLMRYMIAVNRHDLYIHLTRYTGSYGVIESILEKLKKIIGANRSQIIIEETKIPELGTPLEEMPLFTEEFMKALRNNLTEKEFNKILADNHHQIPKSVFFDERLRYEQTSSLSEYLEDYHKRMVEQLEEHHRLGKVWYEQIITTEVIDFVRSNQEILSAVYKDDSLYITKIPYDTKAFLEANTDEEKRYYSCHCPFARTSLIRNKPNIDGGWCMCSGGFTKLHFDVLFDQDLPVECLSSAIKGDFLCRFKISLQDISIK